MEAPTFSAGRRVAAERRKAVVLFAELRNFTRISEMLEPQKVLELVSAFFSLAARAVEARGGEVVAAQNDTLVAAFRAPRPTHSAQRAVQAAQDAQRDFGALAAAWERGYGLHAAVALGLHLGATVFGLAGPEGAEQSVAFGDTVSIAERLVHRARAGEFVLSDSVMGALVVENLALEVVPLPPLALARRPAIPIFGVLLDTRLDFT